MELVAEKYKQTEVGLIPSDWGVKAIDKEIDLITGFPFPSSGYSESGIRLLRCSNVKRGVTDWSEGIVQYWPKITPELKPYVLDDGDIVIAMDGSLVGKSFARLTQADLPAILLQRVARIRSNKVDLGYLKEFVCSDYFTKYCETVKTSSAIPHISPKDIRGFVIPIPPTKAEQTAIATALSDADALINSLEKLISKKRNIKQGAMQKLLQPKEGWEVRKLGEVAIFRRGSFPQPYGLDKWYDDISGYPFIQVNDVDDNKKLKPDTKRHISKEAQPYSVFVKKGSIILTIQGSIGRIAITQYDAYVDRTLLLFEEFKVEFNNYFFMLLIHILFEKEKETAPGGIIKTITKAALTNFEISYPKSKEEQTHIATILSDMVAEITALETKLEKYKMIKLGMMQNLLTGKIRLV
jgi:type I restriction enzyme S subunit